MKETIIFDVGDVLVRAFRGFEHKLNKELGTSLTNIDLWTLEIYAFYEGHIAEELYWASQIRRFGWPTTVARLKAMIREHFEAVPGTLEIARELKARGHSLGILSTMSREWAKHMEDQFQYASVFDQVLYSFETGVLKPSPTAFNLACQALKVEPRSCLYIDDNIGNVIAAKSLGFRAHQFMSAEDLRRDLKERRILD